MNTPSSRTDPAHIGYVLKRFPRLSETFVAAELLELQRQGQRVTVFALNRPDEAVRHRFLDELDVEVRYLPHRPLRQIGRVVTALANVARRHPLGLLSATGDAVVPPTLRRWRKLLQAAVLATELRAAGADHAHAHFASSAARLAQLAHRMGGPPFSVTAHAKDIYHGDVHVDRLAATLGEASFVATVSADNADYLRGVLGGRGHVEHVANSVDLSRVTVPVRAPQPRRILAVARLVEKKGLPDLVAACGLLARRGRPVHLEIVGDGPLRGELQQQAQALGIDVTFAGSLDHDEVVARYASAALFALPCVVAANGDRDGLPTSVLEAMACGVPVVTTPVNGLREAVIDGDTGLLVDEHDPDGLADAIERILDDPELGAKLGDAASAHVADHFCLATNVARLRELFRRVHTGHATHAAPCRADVEVTV